MRIDVEISAYNFHYKYAVITLCSDYHIGEKNGPAAVAGKKLVPTWSYVSDKALFPHKSLGNSVSAIKALLLSSLINFTTPLYRLLRTVELHFRQISQSHNLDTRNRAAVQLL